MARLGRQRLPRQVWVCDSCGHKFALWDEKPWVRPNFSQILCEKCKDHILTNMERSGHFSAYEIKTWFRRTKLTQCKFK